MPAGEALPRTLVAYGHSWVAGEAASRPELCFVELAAAELGLTPLNRGVGGCATADVAAFIRQDPPPPSALYVLLSGLNDARRHGDDPGALTAYEANLRVIFGALRAAAPGAEVVAVAQPHLVDYSGYSPHNRGSNEVLDAYNERLRAVAERPAVVPAWVDGWDPTTMLDADTVHPNDAGHAALARTVAGAARGRG